MSKVSLYCHRLTDIHLWTFQFTRIVLDLENDGKDGWRFRWQAAYELTLLTCKYKKQLSFWVQRFFTVTFPDIRTNGHTCTMPNRITSFNSLETVQRTYVFKFHPNSSVYSVVGIKVKNLEFNNFWYLKTEWVRVPYLAFIYISTTAQSNFIDIMPCPWSSDTFTVQLLKFYYFVTTPKWLNLLLFLALWAQPNDDTFHQCSILICYSGYLPLHF